MGELLSGPAKEELHSVVSDLMPRTTFSKAS